jgi:hypothetical protein
MRKLQLEDLRSTQCAGAEAGPSQRKYKEDKKFKNKKDERKKRNSCLRRVQRQKIRKRLKKCRPKRERN